MSMPTAVVLVNYEFGTEKETINKLKTVPGVIEASEVNGVYDITSNNLDNLKDTIRRRIRTIDTSNQARSLWFFSNMDYRQNSSSLHRK